MTFRTCFLWCAMLGGRSAPAAERPNLVFFLVDDMGWMDSGVYGSKYCDPPNIDRLAMRFMRFTRAFAQPLCSPTRASLLSGQYSARHGITGATGHVAPQPEGHDFLKDTAPPDVPMLTPESKNYLDAAQITLAKTHKGEYIVDRQAAEAAKFIVENKGGPFFLNLWCDGVHGPWGHKEEYTREFANSSEAVVGSADVYPTVLDLLGIAKPEKQCFDGVSYAKVLKGEGQLERTAYFTYFPHGKKAGVTVHSGDFKLIRWFGNPSTHELYKLRDDLSEATHLAAAVPDKVKELNVLIDGFLKGTGATYPRPNPAFVPTKAMTLPAK